MNKMSSAKAASFWICDQPWLLWLYDAEEAKCDHSYKGSLLYESFTNPEFGIEYFHCHVCQKNWQNILY